MRSVVRHIFLAAGLISIAFFCVNAAVVINSSQPESDPSLSEPLRMLLLGMGLLGFSSIIKSWFTRQWLSKGRKKDIILT